MRRGKKKEGMATVLFDCVYTAQKTQKSKKYQDGRVKYNRDNHKVSLYDMEVNKSNIIIVHFHIISKKYF